ncbi:hypothetical protein [Flavobacterium sp. DG1-102-2]|uniref:hypothetical protein n=1 Tax=Flavobacterium sp. DG1-102-2 TaxID=3081663 RepID=UPI00294B71C3|nr:hypothetical protein [Flavobacterium sp. DG1-102-2]
MDNRIFFNRIPQKMDFWFLLFLNIILAFSSGIPTTIAPYLIGDQSAVPADVTMAGFAYFTGMACMFPIILRLKQFTNTKLILGCSFLALLFFNFLLSVSNAPLIMIMASFAIGCVKMLATLEIVLSLIPILMPKGERYQLYCIYYPLSMVFGPVSGLLAAYLADTVNWHYSFHEQNFFIFIGLLIIVLFVHPEKRSKKIPLVQFDWLGNIFLVISLLLMCYVMSYGLMQDWFASVKIQAATIGSIIALLTFLHSNMRNKRPIINFTTVASWHVLCGVFVLCCLCMLFNTGSLTSPFLAIVFKNNPLESAKINTYGTVGYLFGSFLCFLYYRKFMNFTPMAATACVLFLVSNLGMYYITTINASPNDLFLPMFFRAMATIITYISVGIYITSNIPLNYFNDVTMFLIAVRTLLVPVVASALYSNWHYHEQIKYTTRLANTMDALNPLVAVRNTQLVSSVKVQASLLALRDIYGALIIMSLVLLVIILFIPFHGSNKRIIFNWRDPLHGKEAAQAITV